MPHRDCQHEYNKYYGRGPASACTPLQRKHRKHTASRARALKLMKSKRTIPHNHDVDHKNGNPLDNRASNLKVIHRHVNRGKK
jgi:hypothetical protein